MRIAYISSLICLSFVTLAAAAWSAPFGFADPSDRVDKTMMQFHDHVVAFNKAADLLEAKVVIAEPANMAASTIDRCYVSMNQPGQSWRLAVDAYRHIDPGRLLI